MKTIRQAIQESNCGSCITDNGEIYSLENGEYKQLVRGETLPYPYFTDKQMDIVEKAYEQDGIGARPLKR